MDFDKLGQQIGQGRGTCSNAAMKINQLADEYAKSAGVSFAKAVDHVVTNTPEGRSLYGETITTR